MAFQILKEIIQIFTWMFFWFQKRYTSRLKERLIVRFEKFDTPLYFWNFSSRSEDMKIFSVNINYFHRFFGSFNIFLLQRN